MLSSQAFQVSLYILFTSGYWQEPLCTLQLAGSIMKPKHQNCEVFFSLTAD